ncbi:MAG: PIG-L deacetylase family protein [Acidimicrobiales bacterium]
MTEITVDLPVPERALAIGAHPDDVEFGCGGTLAKWAAAGTVVHHLVCTDGSKGSWDPSADTVELVAQRQEEQRAAALALGGSDDVVFCDWVDGELEAGLGQRSEVASWIRRLRPQVVLGHDPWKRYRLHPDHRAAGFLVTDAIVAARDPHFLTGLGLAPYRPSTLLLWEADAPDHVEDIGDHLVAKVSAIMCHRSQYRSTMEIEDPSSAVEVDRFRAKVADRAAEHGRLASLALGEQFKAVRRL